jgi:hypothetical protein
MTNTQPWHSTVATDRPLYHDDTRCPEGQAIALKNRRPGDGGRDPCPYCAGLLGALSAATPRASSDLGSGQAGHRRQGT